jgi:hypothetical protein
VTKNCYYKQWTKNHKLRVQLDQYAEFGAFAFSAKADAVSENQSLQYSSHVAVPCPERDVSATASCVHPAEHDKRLPETIRGGHYLHNRHVCAVLGCEYAPYDRIKDLFQQSGDLIIPFPILCKDTYHRIEEIVKSDTLLAGRSYIISNVSVRNLFSMFQESQTTLLYGNGIDNGYPVSEVIQGIAYIVANDDELFGKRLRSSYKDVVERHLIDNPNLSVEVRTPDLLTPLVIVGNERGVLVGARNPQVYKKLISIAPNNEYKLQVRPITEGDLCHAK